MVAGAALDAAALMLLGLSLVSAGAPARGDVLLRSVPGELLQMSGFTSGDVTAPPAFAVAAAAFLYLMIRIVFGLLTGAISLFGARGRIRS